MNYTNLSLESLETFKVIFSSMDSMSFMDNIWGADPADIQLLIYKRNL